ncbi:hypothetical protein TNCV_2600081 [Trichonephila clavipes]|nr:hypothetical protein TNCV_2600081 [Trichonephila clavipes]
MLIQKIIVTSRVNPLNPVGGLVPQPSKSLVGKRSRYALCTFRFLPNSIDSLIQNASAIQINSIAVLCYYRKATRELLATDLVILSHGHVKRTTPEQAPPLLTTTLEMFEFSTDLTYITPQHGRYSVVLGSNLGFRKGIGKVSAIWFPETDQHLFCA